MNKPTNTNVLLVILLLVALSGWYWSTTRSVSLAPSTNLTPSAVVAPAATATKEAQGSTIALMTATVNYTANGFTPDPVTIKQGGTVTFVSKDGSPMWVASNAHPTHMQYDGTSKKEHCPNAGTAFDQCSSGASYSFTFQKVGSWNYHNHVNADDGGTITVVQ